MLYHFNVVNQRYQLSRFLILMERYDEAIRAADTATNSHGSAMRENERYLDSYEAKINMMKNAWTETTIAMQDAFLGDAILSFTYITTDLIKGLTAIIDTVGLLPPMFAVAGLAVGAFKNQLIQLYMSKVGSELLSTANSVTVLSTQFRHGSVSAQLLAAGMTAANIAGNLLGATLRFIGTAILPMLAFTAVGFAISKVTEKMVENRQEAEKLQRTMEEMRQSNIDAVTTNKQQVDELLNTYKHMRAVRPDGGFENIEQEKEYLDIQEQLVNLFPSLVSHIDSKGQTVLKSNEAIEQQIKLSEELVELERQKRILEAQERFDDSSKDLEVAKKLIQAEQEIYDRINKRLQIAKEDPSYKDRAVKRLEDDLERASARVEEARLNFEFSASNMRSEFLQTFEDIAHDLGQKAPEIKKMIDDIVGSFDFKQLNLSGEELKTVSDRLVEFGNSLEQARKKGDMSGFKSTLKDLNSYLENLGMEQAAVKFEEFLEQLDKLEGSNVDELVASISGEFEELADNVEDTNEALDEFNNAISVIEELNGLLNELDDGGISPKSIGVIIEKHQEFLHLLGDEVKLREAIEEKIEEQTELAMESLRLQKLENEKFYDYLVESENILLRTMINIANTRLKEMGENYRLDLNNFKDLATAKAEVEKALLLDLTNAWKKYLGATLKGSADIGDYVTPEGRLTESGSKHFQSLRSNPQAELDLWRAIADYQQDVQRINKIIDDISKIDVNFSTNNLNNSIRNAGRDLGKTTKATNKAAKATKDKAKEDKLASYISDNYASILEYVNTQLAKQNTITSQFPKHSKEYRESLKVEIDLLKEKSKILEAQSKDIEKQIKQGSVTQTGVVSSDKKSVKVSTSDTSPYDVARYYLNSFRVSSPFGERESPGGIGSTNHRGVDFARGRAGDPVKAIRSGKVTSAYYSKSGGNMVVVQQDDGTIARYLHMQNLGVKKGQSIKAGQQLGRVGNTGNSTGPHLHLDIQRGGNFIDPIPYLNQLHKSGATTVVSNVKQEVAQAHADIDGLKSELLKVDKEIFDNDAQIAQLRKEIVQSKIEAVYYKYNQQLSELEYRYEHNEKLLGRVKQGTDKYGKSLREQEDILQKRAALIYDQRQELLRLIDTQNLSADQYDEVVDQLRQLSLAYQDLQDSINQINLERVNNELAKFEESIRKLTYNIERNKKILSRFEIDEDGVSKEYIQLQNEIIRQTKVHAEQILAQRQEIAKLLPLIRKNKQLVAEKTKELDNLSLAYHDLLTEIQNMENQLRDHNRSIADDTISVLKDALTKQKELRLAAFDEETKQLNDTHQKRIDKIREETDEYEKAIRKQIAALDKLRKTERHEKEVEKRQSEILKIQRRIDLLSMDDSFGAQAERAKLEEELAELKDGLNEFQRDREIELRKEALQELLEAYKEQKEEERKIEDENHKKASNNRDKERREIERLFNEKIANERKWGEIREEILKGNIDSVRDRMSEFLEEFAKMNDKTATKIGISYQEVLNMIDKINNASDSLGGITTIPDNATNKVFNVISSAYRTREEALKMMREIEVSYSDQLLDANVTQDKYGRWIMEATYENQERAQGVLDRLVEIGYVARGGITDVSQTEQSGVKTMAFATEKEAQRIVDILLQDYDEFLTDAFVAYENGVWRAYGFYEDMDKAHRVLDRIIDFGYIDFGRVIDSQEEYRSSHKVSSTGLRDRERAEALAREMEKSYQARYATVTQRDGKWYAEGYFKDLERAEAVLNRMEEMSHLVSDSPTEGTRTEDYHVYNVVTQGFDNRKDAEGIVYDFTHEEGYGALAARVQPHDDGTYSAIGSFARKARAEEVLDRLIKIRGITGRIERIETKHDGGIVGNSPLSRTGNLLNKLLNTKSNEQIVKSLKGEIQVPPKNFSNVFNNIKNLINSSNTPAIVEGDNYFEINFNIDKMNGDENDVRTFSKKFAGEMRRKGVRLKRR